MVEVFLTLNGARRYLWRAVDPHGAVLDILVQARRDGRAATRFFRKLLKKQGCRPRVPVTDKLGSYQVEHRNMMSSVEHRQSKCSNNPAENSHQSGRECCHDLSACTLVCEKLQRRLLWWSTRVVRS